MNNGWKKDFDEKFGLPEKLPHVGVKKHWKYGEVCEHDDYFACEKRLEVIKDFIESTHKELREDIVRKLEEINAKQGDPIHCGRHDFPERMNDQDADVYNQAIKKAISIIRDES